jgi:hypothetical protein
MSTSGISSASANGTAVSVTAWCSPVGARCSAEAASHEVQAIRRTLPLNDEPIGGPYSCAVPGHINYRGWIVLTSISSGDHALCVDLFEDPAGGFGFEHFRSDPEDDGRWTAIGGFGSARFGTRSEAARVAKDSVLWLEQAPRARASLEAWLTKPEST